VKQHFKTVKIRKPAASRPRSREVYVLAQGFML
jgi:23S rRNA (uridine2552-2'-O)-methyltransferase